MKQLIKKYNEFLKWTLGSLNAIGIFLIMLFKDDGAGCCIVSILGVGGIAICLVLLAAFLIFKWNKSRAEKFWNKFHNSGK